MKRLFEMCYESGAIYRAVKYWAMDEQYCICCWCSIHPAEDWIAGLFFSETMDEVGPLEFEPGTRVVPYILCSHCYCNDSFGQFSYNKTLEKIEKHRHDAILDGWLHEVPISLFMRSTMIEFSDN